MGFILFIFDFAVMLAKEIWYILKQNIQFADGIITGVFVYFIAKECFDWSTGWVWFSAILAATIVCGVLLAVFTDTRVGFWIATVIFSGIWSVLATAVSYVALILFSDLIEFTVENWMLWIAAGLSFAYSIHLHICSRYVCIAEEEKREEIRRHWEKPVEIEEVWFDPREDKLQPISTKPPEADNPDWMFEQMQLYEKKKREAWLYKVRNIYNDS